MKNLTVYQIDAFTKEKFKGNPAGVVLNADELTDNEMQMIARELNNSETAFLFSSDNDNCDAAIRYFTPTAEVPICGHATIAAMYAKAIVENLEACVLKIKTNIGILPFEIIKQNKDYQVVMTQGEFELSESLDESVISILLKALGLEQKDLDEKCPMQIASTGHSKVMIGIKNRQKLNSLTPNMFELAKLSETIKCNGYFVFTFDSDDPNISTYGRMFAPAIGINEDPVTGNANGPLGGYLIANNLIDYTNNVININCRQGEQMNRLGTVNVKVTIVNNIPQVIKITGEAVVVFKTEISI